MTSEWSIAWAMRAPAPAVSTAVCARSAAGESDRSARSEQASGHECGFRFGS